LETESVHEGLHRLGDAFEMVVEGDANRTLVHTEPENQFIELESVCEDTVNTKEEVDINARCITQLRGL